MKKLVILTLAFLMSLGTFANFQSSKITDWDKPLCQRVWTPTVATLYLTCSATELVIASELYQPGIEDGNTWRMTIPTRSYCYMLASRPIPHMAWQWVTFLYTIDFCPSCLTSTKTIPLNYQEQFITYSGTFGYGGVRDDQYYISSFVSL